MKQQPTAWVTRHSGTGEVELDEEGNGPTGGWSAAFPVYERKPWVELTEGEIQALHSQLKVQLLGTFSVKDIYRAVEAALQEKNA